MSSTSVQALKKNSFIEIKLTDLLKRGLHNFWSNPRFLVFFAPFYDKLQNSTSGLFKEQKPERLPSQNRTFKLVRGT